MAWLTTYTSANRITDEQTNRKEVLVLVFGGTSSYTRDVTEERYRYVAMDKTSAISAMNALVAATPGGTTRQVTIRRQGPADGFDVCVSDIVYGAWTPVP